jgi:glyoxylase-like metal-dependent hydrolase (beta-lactamase superfamily II)
VSAPATPEEVLPGLWRVGGGSWNGTVPALSFEDDANVWLVRGPAGLALVDCGMTEGRAAIAANVRAAGVEPDALGDLLLTHSHWDHTQAARAWQIEHGLRTHLNGVGADFLARGDLRLTGAPLHGPGFAFESFAVDHAVADGEEFELVGIRVETVFLPGHTPDSTAYVTEYAGLRIGLTGDVAFGPTAGGLHPLGFLSPLWLSDVDDYRASLRRLEALGLDVLLPGHGAPVRGREAVRMAVRTALETAERYAADPTIHGNFGV